MSSGGSELENFAVQYCNRNVAVLLGELRNELYNIITKYNAVTLEWKDVGYLVDKGSKTLESVLMKYFRNSNPHFPHGLIDNLVRSAISTTSSKVIYTLLELNTLKLDISKRPFPDEIVLALFGEIQTSQKKEVNPFVDRFVELYAVIGRLVHDCKTVRKEVLNGTVKKPVRQLLTKPPTPRTNSQNKHPPPGYPPKEGNSDHGSTRSSLSKLSKDEEYRRISKERYRHPVSGRRSLPVFEPPRYISQHDFPVVREIVKNHGSGGAILLNTLTRILKDHGLIPEGLRRLFEDHGKRSFGIVELRSGEVEISLKTNIRRGDSLTGEKRDRDEYHDHRYGYDERNKRRKY